MKRVRCAVYTRQSSDEGLVMEFGSLESQRSQCEAYVGSQRHEGWVLLQARYDDGGFSGGTLERPGLQRLLGDVESEKVDQIVIYKVDRLTRSLIDFSQLAEIFERNNVTFTSVTQAFSTATSIGQLTLNMLLSFGQYERELARERLLDKHVASRKRGIWMGGWPSLGYDLVDRKLRINEQEAVLVRHIFQRFVELGSATHLVEELKRDGHRSKSWTTKGGHFRQGAEFNKGTLYKLLNNPIYLGNVVHKGMVYTGEHDAIISQEVWDQVHDMMKNNAVKHRSQTRAQSPAPLKGLIFCHRCNRAMVPTHTRKKSGKQFRYYVCTTAVKKSYGDCPMPTVPAGEIEGLVFDHIRALIRSPELAAKTWRFTHEDGDGLPVQTIIDALKNLEPVWDVLFPKEQVRLLNLLVKKIVIVEDGISLQLRLSGLQSLVREVGHEADDLLNLDQKYLTIHIPVVFKNRGGKKWFVTPAAGTDWVAAKPNRDPDLVRALVLGRKWWKMLEDGVVGSINEIAVLEKVSRPLVQRRIDMTLLAPDIVAAIMGGRQPQGFSMTSFRNAIPGLWEEQRRVFGIFGSGGWGDQTGRR